MVYRYKGSPPTSLSFSLFSAAPPLLFCHYYSLSAAVTSPTFCYITVPCSVVGNFFFFKVSVPRYLDAVGFTHGQGICICTYSSDAEGLQSTVEKYWKLLAKSITCRP